MDNAVKYTEKGKVWISAAFVPRPKQLGNDSSSAKTPAFAEASAGKQDSGIEVRVNDTGMGLDPEDANKLFDKPARQCILAGIYSENFILSLVCFAVK